MVSHNLRWVALALPILVAGESLADPLRDERAAAETVWPYEEESLPSGARMTVHLGSRHWKTDHDPHERNLGFAYRHPVGEGYWTAGQYRNSFRDTSRYLAWGQSLNEVPAGWMVGAVSGYDERPLPALIPYLEWNHVQVALLVNENPSLTFSMVLEPPF